MRVLVACEYSGIVRDAFTAKGHDAWSCDILPTESEGNHIQGDVLEHLDKGWDLMIAHPPCTYLSNAGTRWFNEERYGDQARERKRARNGNAPLAEVGWRAPRAFQRMEERPLLRQVHCRRGIRSVLRGVGVR